MAVQSGFKSGPWHCLLFLVSPISPGKPPKLTLFYLQPLSYRRPAHSVLSVFLETPHKSPLEIHLHMSFQTVDIWLGLSLETGRRASTQPRWSRRYLQWLRLQQLQQETWNLPDLVTLSLNIKPQACVNIWGFSLGLWDFPIKCYIFSIAYMSMIQPNQRKRVISTLRLAWIKSLLCVVRY